MDRACFLSQQLVARQPGSRRHLSLAVPMGTIGEPNGCDWFCARHLRHLCPTCQPSGQSYLNDAVSILLGHGNDVPAKQKRPTMRSLVRGGGLEPPQDYPTST